MIAVLVFLLKLLVGVFLAAKLVLVALAGVFVGTTGKLLRRRVTARARPQVLVDNQCTCDQGCSQSLARPPVEQPTEWRCG